MERLYNWKNFPAEVLSSARPLTRPRGNLGGNKRIYLEVFGAFDIETTRLDDEHSVMYIWQLQLGVGCTVIGRSWKELRRCLQRIRSLLPEGVWFVLLVHNLSFEFQFLRGFYKFRSAEVFAVDKRRPLRVDMEKFRIEFRCTYLHTNMSLGVYLDKMGVEHPKQAGFDYEKKRWPWTPLSDQEILYAVNDVRGLVEAYTIEMMHDGDNLYSVPATSTGYVRRDVKKAMSRLRFGFVRDQLPDLELFTMLREAFRGGNTHANRYYSGQLLRDVGSYDRSSSYPDVQLNCEFPIGRFRKVPHEIRLAELEDLINRRHKAVVMRIALWIVRLKDPLWGCPYLAVDKCRRIYGGAEDNGRILRADYLETTITDVDFKILIQEYDFDGVKIIDCAYARYGQLPEPLKNCIRTYYKLKTALKGNKEQALLYEKSKNKLNSIYGMSAQSPVKFSIVYGSGPDGWDLDDSLTVEELLEKSKKRAFIPYQWGVWTVAWARYRLEQGIRLVSDPDNPDRSKRCDFVYCDTDSVKFIGHPDFSKLNNELRSLSIEHEAWADDPAGIRHYMGVYEADDGYPVTEFATRGAKKYVCRHPDGKLEATIAGVAKRGAVTGGEELEEAGGISAFLLPEFVFTKAGGTAVVYNDHDRYFVRIDGHRLQVRECVTILPDTYTLSDTVDYNRLLKDSSAIRKFLLDNYGQMW